MNPKITVFTLALLAASAAPAFAQDSSFDSEDYGVVGHVPSYTAPTDKQTSPVNHQPATDRGVQVDRASQID
jgi:hypothetical protein